MLLLGCCSAWGAVLHHRAFSEEMSPSCPGGGSALGGEQGNGVQCSGWGGSCKQEGDSTGSNGLCGIRYAIALNLHRGKTYFLFLLQTPFLTFGVGFLFFLLKCQNLQVWQARQPNPITKILKSFNANYFIFSLLKEI